jgi:hypothetical protein
MFPENAPTPNSNHFPDGTNSGTDLSHDLNRNWSRSRKQGASSRGDQAGSFFVSLAVNAREAGLRQHQRVPQ